MPDLRSRMAGGAIALMLEERILPKGTTLYLTGRAVTLLSATAVAAKAEDWADLERVHVAPEPPRPSGGKLRVSGAKDPNRG